MHSHADRGHARRSGRRSAAARGIGRTCRRSGRRARWAQPARAGPGRADPPPVRAAADHDYVEVLSTVPPPVNGATGHGEMTGKFAARTIRVATRIILPTSASTVPQPSSIRGTRHPSSAGHGWLPGACPTCQLRLEFVQAGPEPHGQPGRVRRTQRGGLGDPRPRHRHAQDVGLELHQQVVGTMPPSTCSAVELHAESAPWPRAPRASGRRWPPARRGDRCLVV